MAIKSLNVARFLKILSTKIRIELSEWLKVKCNSYYITVCFTVTFLIKSSNYTSINYDHFIMTSENLCGYLNVFQNLPTFFIYYEGEMKKQLVGAMTFGGMNCKVDGEFLCNKQFMELVLMIIRMLKVVIIWGDVLTFFCFSKQSCNQHVIGLAHLEK